VNTKTLPIVTRLGIIYAVLGAAFVAQALLSHFNVQNLGQVYQDQIRAERSLDGLVQDLYALRLKVFQYLGTSKPAEMESIKAEAGTLSADIAKGLQGKDRQGLAALFAKAQAEYAEIIAAHGDFKTKDAYQKIYGASQATFQESRTQIETLTAKAKAEALEGEIAARASVFMATMGAAVLVALVLVFLIVYSKRVIVSPLNHLTAFAARVSQGEMTADIQGRYRAELAILKESLLRMVENLKLEILKAAEEESRAKEAADQAMAARTEALALKAEAEEANARMQDAAQELEQVAGILSSATQELSHQIDESAQGAEVQQARASESLGAITELSKVSLEVASNASVSAQLAERTKSEAETGSSVVSSVVETILKVHGQAQTNKADMAELDKQAEEINKIMDVIDDIADQTNLLALNAAIEAARAGEAGRGFAVVADEVRKLAERTMNATKEVGDAIGRVQNAVRRNVAYAEESNAAISDSVDKAKRSGEALARIVEFIDQTSGQVHSIAAAAEEQSASTDHVKTAVEEVSAIATETAQAMGESASAITELAAMSGRLAELIAAMRSLAPSQGREPLALQRAPARARTTPAPPPRTRGLAHGGLFPRV